MKELSSTFFYNKDYIMRLFKKEIHMTIIEYINSKRIFLSLKALKEKSSSVLAISIQYGFASQEYYCETFHSVMGVSPSEYQTFLNGSVGLDEESVFSIQDRLSYFASFFELIEEYKKNTPPKSTIKVLSIFK